MSHYYHRDLAFVPTEAGLRDITGIRLELRHGEPERIEGVRIPPERTAPREPFEPIDVAGERVSDQIIRERR